MASRKLLEVDLTISGHLRAFGHARFVNHRFRVRAPGSAPTLSLSNFAKHQDHDAPAAGSKPPLRLALVARHWARRMYDAGDRAEREGRPNGAADWRARAFRLDDWASRR